MERRPLAGFAGRRRLPGAQVSALDPKNPGFGSKCQKSEYAGFPAAQSAMGRLPVTPCHAEQWGKHRLEVPVHDHA